MPAPDGFNPVFNAPVELALESRGPGTYTTGPLSADPSWPMSDIELWVHVTEISGSPTLNCSLESSPDDTTWTAIAGSGIQQLSVAGNATANAIVPAGEYVRITSTVGGTGSPSMTYRVLAIAALYGAS